MFEVIFLFVLALVWIFFATLQDIRTREIANWLSFSLIVFALGFRFFYSLFFSGDFNFLYQGLIGLGIFFVLGNLFYYGKMFAGGDAKLFIAMGAILPFSENLSANVGNFLFFFFIFLFAGAAYSIIVSTWLCFRNYNGFKREFKKQFKEKKRLVILITCLAIVIGLSGLFINTFLFYLAILTFLLPYLYLYAKAVDETAMVKTIDSRKLREGDWLYRDVRVKGKVIKARWDGLTNEEIRILRKNNKKIKIREGVVFTPVFLISFPVFFYLWNKGLGYSFW